jgi:hypothetical protein
MVGLVACVGLVAALAIVWHFSRAASLLRQWAEENGYCVVHSEYRYFFRGPFFWTTSNGQAVYRVTVEDSEGSLRNGWVRCGGWLLGLFSDHVEARWDD